MRFLFLCLFVLLPITLAGQSFVLLNEGLLSKKVVDEINLIGGELFDKTGLFVGVIIGDESSFEDLLKLAATAPSPYLLLVLSKSSQHLDLIGQTQLIDKEAVLSPYPSTGTILPILASKKGDIYNAAVLNGYADLAERVAGAKGVKLENALGNANKNTINALRALIYGCILLALLLLVRQKMRRKRAC